MRWSHHHEIHQYVCVWWLEILYQNLVGSVSGWCGWRLLERECLCHWEAALMFGKKQDPFSKIMGSSWGWKPSQGLGDWCHATFLHGSVKDGIKVEEISWRPFLWMKMSILEDKLTIRKIRRPKKHKETLALPSEEEHQAKGTWCPCKEPCLWGQV